MEKIQSFCLQPYFRMPIIIKSVVNSIDYLQTMQGIVLFLSIGSTHLGIHVQKGHPKKRLQLRLLGRHGLVHRHHHNPHWYMYPRHCDIQNMVEGMSSLYEGKLPIEMSLSWNFPTRAEPSYEVCEPSQAGPLQFPS